jgi:4'-phosphopantetheinyl transferase
MDRGGRLVDVWILEHPEQIDGMSADRAEALLSAEERARMRRFRWQDDRRRYLGAHALVRTALSRRRPTTRPESWQFVLGEHGRPEVAPEPQSDLRFNLSHTNGIVACVVTTERDVGVDVERLESAPPDLALLEGLAQSEARDVEAQPSDTRQARFLAIWTLKEAYLKARGLGLAMGLDQFAFELGGVEQEATQSPEIRVRFEPGANDDPRRWHFMRLSPGPRHVLAVAALVEPGELLAVRVRHQSKELPWAT